MDVLNHFDSESSSDSNRNVRKDHVLVEDSNCRNESDQVSSSTQTICINSSTHSGNSSVSLLSILKASDMSELSHKQITSESDFNALE